MSDATPMCFCGFVESEHSDVPPDHSWECQKFRPRIGVGAGCMGGRWAAPCTKKPVATVNGESIYGWRACRTHADEMVTTAPHLSLVWDQAA